MKLLLATTVVMCTTIALPSHAAPDDALQVTAALPTSPMTVGSTYQLEVTIEPGTNYSTADAGIPKPILQIDVPECIELVGRVLTERELSRNEFLHAPYARMIDDGATLIGFTLKSEPSEDDHLAVNVLAYVQNSTDEQSYFVRRRVELSIEPGAKGISETMATSSQWGVGTRLQIGDTIEPLTLPRADGTEVSVNDALGDGPAVLITYRAFW